MYTISRVKGYAVEWGLWERMVERKGSETRAMNTTDLFVRSGPILWRKSVNWRLEGVTCSTYGYLFSEDVHKLKGVSGNRDAQGVCAI